MSKETPWVRAESSSHPGRFYYFNRVTKASTWERPPGLEKIPSLSPGKGRGKRGEVADVSGEKPPLQNAWSQPVSGADETESADSDGKNSDKKADRVKPTATRLGLATQKPRGEKAIVKEAMAGSLPPLKGGDAEEAMEVERWGEEEEVAMDIDVSQEDIAEMKLVRSSLSSPSQLHIESFGIPADYTNDYSEKLYLVLDTNVLLSHLNFLEELKDYAMKGVGKPVLVIPWIVMQELDKHKMRGNDRLAGKARKAIRLLFSCFTCNHPRVRCQTMEETQTEVHNVSIANNDDRILHCCLLYQTKTRGHNGIVVLFSNDLNLCSKALSNRVKAADRTTLFKELRGLCQAPPTTTPPAAAKPAEKRVPLILNIPPAGSPTHGHTSSEAVHMDSPPVTPFTPSTPGSALPLNIPPSALSSPPGLQRSKEVNDIVAEVETVIREALSIPLKQEMMDAFDNLWSTMVAKKPPWSLKDELFLIDKHWIAVYGQVLQPHVRGVASQLFHSLKNRPGVQTVDEALMFVRSSISLIQGFTDCSYCSDTVRSAVSKLNASANKLRLMKKKPVGGVASSTLSLRSPTSPSPAQPPVALVSPMGPVSMTRLSPAGVLTNPPSSLPLLPLSPLTSSPSLSLKENLALVAQTPPTDPSRQLEWVLGLVHDSVVYSQSMVQETLGSSQTSTDCANVCCFMRQIGELLSQIVSSLQSLLELGVTIPRMQAVLVALDFFLCQAVRVNSPLTINTFFELVSIKEQRELLETALKTFTDMLAQLQSIDASFET